MKSEKEYQEQETIEGLINSLHSGVTKAKSLRQIYHHNYEAHKKQLTKEEEQKLGTYEYREQEIAEVQKKNTAYGNILKHLKEFLDADDKVQDILSKIFSYIVNAPDANIIEAAQAITEEIKHKLGEELFSIFNNEYRKSSSLAFLDLLQKDSLSAIAKDYSDIASHEMSCTKVGILQLKHALICSLITDAEVSSEIIPILEDYGYGFGEIMLEVLGDTSRLAKSTYQKFARHNQLLIEPLLENILEHNKDDISFKHICFFIFNNKHLYSFFTRSNLTAAQMLYQTITGILEKKNIDLASKFEEDPFWHIACANNDDFQEFIAENHQYHEVTSLGKMMRSLVSIAKVPNFSAVVTNNDKQIFDLEISKSFLPEQINISGKKLKELAPSFDHNSETIGYRKSSYEIIEPVNSKVKILPESGNKKPLNSMSVNKEASYYDEICNKLTTECKRIIQKLPIPVNILKLVEDKFMEEDSNMPNSANPPVAGNDNGWEKVEEGGVSLIGENTIPE